ncbi:hypothetical protein F511_09216 [Dorcoceras hygrometricum]|uniref:Uncharacterized protein n=1 Tax=Dorcoceras hygrometricum TaxID=472368 RepID=A0A2Z7CR03_9LAMI|nr:hypothetical protein F511_09216 [Dorcoceras hygrometricum]
MMVTSGQEMSLQEVSMQEREVLCVVVFLRLDTQLRVMRIAYPMRRRLKHCSTVSFSGGFPSFLVVVLLVRDSSGLLSRSLIILGFDPMSLWGLVCFFVMLFSGNPGSTAGRGFNPAGGAPGGG